MTEAKHTPGPWEYVEPEYLSHDAHGYEHVVAPGGILGGEPEEPSWVIEGGIEHAPDARLIAAAPDLLTCQTMGASKNTPDFLDWLANRLVDVYGENPNIDFVLSLRERANAGRAAIAKAEGQS